MQKSSFVSLITTIATLLFATVALAQGSRDRIVLIQNKSSHEVYNIRVAPSHRSKYGDENLLDGEVIKPGQDTEIDFDTDDAENSCVLDVRAEALKKKWTIRIDVCKQDLWTLHN